MKDIETTVSIQGELWRFKIASEHTDKRLKDCEGYCEPTLKLMVADNLEELDYGDKISRMRHIITHELIHAFLFESGLANDWQHPDHGHDETMIDWVSSQFDKISDVRQTLINWYGKKVWEDPQCRNNTSQTQAE